MVQKTECGFANGYKCYLVTLRNKNGMSVSLTNYAGSIVKLCVPDKNGGLTDVMLGYDNLDGYVNGKSAQGALIGRYGNRIGGAEFTVGGKEYKLAKNNGAHCLHGGNVGYNKRVWDVYGISDGESPSVAFSYVSPDGEENFPAEVRIIVRYTLTVDNSLRLNYCAVPDGETVINLTNHAYFNLGGHDSGDILDTSMQIFADKYTLVDKDLIPTGEIAAVKNTPFDFNMPKLIGDDIKSIDIGGYDHNYILGDPGTMCKASVAYDEDTGIQMTTYTDMPAMQFYIALNLDETGKGGVYRGKFAGFCLETQFSPNTPNMPDFPQCTFKKGEEYRFITEYAFAVK